MCLPLHNHLVIRSNCIQILCYHTAPVAEGFLFELPYRQSTEQAASKGKNSKKQFLFISITFKSLELIMSSPCSHFHPLLAHGLLSVGWCTQVV